MAVPAQAQVETESGNLLNRLESLYEVLAEIDNRVSSISGQDAAANEALTEVKLDSFVDKVSALISSLSSVAKSIDDKLRQFI